MKAVTTNAAAGDLTLFDLTRPGSPFSKELYLLPLTETPSRPTTQHFQLAVLARGSGASRPYSP